MQRVPVRKAEPVKALWPVVLGYHRITDERATPLCVSPTAFKAQMEMLLSWGLRPTTLPGRGRGRFVVTFDDGYCDNYTEAAPVLDRHSIPGVFYVCTGYVGTDRMYPRVAADDGDLEGNRLMGWAEVIALDRSGHTIGSHTASHTELPALGDEELLCELSSSRTELEARLGHPVSDFCYPRGKHDARVRAAVGAAGYERAVVTPSTGRVDDDPLTIERVGIYRHDSPWRFRAKVLGLYRLARPLVRR